MNEQEVNRTVRCEICTKVIGCGFSDPCKCPNPKPIDSLEIFEVVNVQENDWMKAKVTDKKFSGKKKTRVEIFEGDDFSHAKKKYMKKSRRIDKDNNTYTEHIVDPDTDEIIHHCAEPLSDHQGHGDAKKKS